MSGQYDPPEPLTGTWVGMVGEAAVIVFLAGVGFMALVGVTPARSSGATASAQLQWEDRRQQMAEETALAIAHGKPAPALPDAALANR